ncbi:hypothetical protein ACLKA6_018885 [Drosophila palustris]
MVFQNASPRTVEFVLNLTIRCCIAMQQSQVFPSHTLNNPQVLSKQFTPHPPITAMASEVEQVVLATAIVSIKGNACQQQPARVHLDSGSPVNFITEELAKSLRLKRIRKDINLLGIGKSSLSAHQVVQTTICSRIHPFELVADFVVLKSISSYQPEKTMPPNTWSIPSDRWIVIGHL